MVVPLKELTSHKLKMHMWGSSHTPPLPNPVGIIIHSSPPLWLITHPPLPSPPLWLIIPPPLWGSSHPSLPSSVEHYSVVEIELNQEKDCTKLLFTQTEIPESEYDRTAQGWKQYYWRSIQSTFGYGAHLL